MVPSATMPAVPFPGVLLTTSLFLLTAVAEILGCFLTDLVVKQHRSPWLLIPAALSLALSTWRWRWCGYAWWMGPPSAAVICWGLW
jgi:hypothetical protein